MSTVLIVVEQRPDGHLRKATLHALFAGQQLAKLTGASLLLVHVAVGAAIGFLTAKAQGIREGS